MYQGKKFNIALNWEQLADLRVLLDLPRDAEITNEHIKQALRVRPDKKAGRPKGAKNKEKIV